MLLLEDAPAMKSTQAESLITPVNIQSDTFISESTQSVKDRRASADRLPLKISASATSSAVLTYFSHNNRPLHVSCAMNTDQRLIKIDHR